MGILEELVLSDIKRVSAFAREHEEEFVQLVSNSVTSEVGQSLAANRKELDSATARVSKIDQIIRRLYEDNLEGNVSDERFRKMTESYEAEQRTLEIRISELKKSIAESEKCTRDTEQFLNLVRNYSDIHCLTAKLVRDFISRIEVSKLRKVNGKKRQKVVIEYNYIGQITLPATKSKTA